MQALKMILQLCEKESIMGKYFLAWLIGVPIGVLVIVWLIFHLF
jgi:hypothetical protein